MSDTSAPKAQNYKFKAEVSQLLDILTHSLYTHRDIFIRELISNAADALDKVRFKDVKGEPVNDPGQKLEMRIELDKDARKFILSDTGIGMTRDELVENIGTIARSGTADFLNRMAEGHEEDLHLIGRFGVGFYSVFMAAEKVEIITKSAEPDSEVLKWISDGKGSFKISEGPEDHKRGTKITVFLKEDAQEFAEEFRVKTAIQNYSNFVVFPVFLGKEQINTVSAIWREPKSSVKKDQYNEFYKFIAHAGDDALTWLHFSSDVPVQFHALLFVPKTNIEMLGFGKEDAGTHLFVKRVLVDAHAKEALPSYLRFVRGVLESDDLPLNVSRETLQENPHLLKIKNTLVSKFLGHLSDFAEKEPEEYKTFWNQHGRILKEGYNDYAHKDKVAALFRYNSSSCENAEELISLKTYIERMPEKQEEIIFLSGHSREALVKNPAMEIFRAKGIEVLLCTDPIDEFVLPGLFEFDGKKIVSADQVDLKKLQEIPDTEELKTKKKKVDEKAVEKLTRRMKNILGEKVEDVRISERLVDSPAVLVSKDAAMSSQMEKLMHMVNKDIKLSPKIMEINKNHSLIQSMVEIYQANPKDALLTKMVNGLLASVMLLDGAVDDPHQMADSIQQLLNAAVNLREQKNNEKEDK